MYVTVQIFERSMKCVALRTKWHRLDLIFNILLLIVQGNCGRLWIQYRCLKRQIKFHIIDKVYIGICERNYLINIDKQCSFHRPKITVCCMTLSKHTHQWLEQLFMKQQRKFIHNNRCVIAIRTKFNLAWTHNAWDLRLVLLGYPYFINPLNTELNPICQ